MEGALISKTLFLSEHAIVWATRRQHVQ